ncbi:MAG: glycoside hydrolase family 99-like domain-containing protein [Bacteroidales bacterium]|nr:glycoside hydrolase family 99-like domain-containing protein [Bacteroidales bacterium]
MNRSLYLILGLGTIALISAFFGFRHKDAEAGTQDDIYVCAYVWPSCHDDQLAHKWLWEEGIGEWEVIKKGDKRFPEHYQPRQPLWGYELDNDPVVVEKWIRTALKYGVNTFIYDWYWYNDPDGYSGPYLESALNDGFLKAPSHDKMHFYIMWANHDVKYNYWNYHKWGDNEERLFNPDVDWDQFKKVVDRVINQYFKLPEYVKIDGCPVLGIFSIENFVRGLGSLDEAAKAIEYFRSEVRKAGFPDLHLQQIQGGGGRMSEERIEYMRKNIKALGIDSEALYNMGGFNPDYLVHGAEAVEIREQMDKVFDIPVFPCVSIGWDDTPRFPAKGPDHVTRFHNTPQSFATFLAKAKEYVEAHPDQPRFMMINAWNEWVEGSYLLPDRLNGFGYLEAVRDVLNGKYDN